MSIKYDEVTNQHVSVHGRDNDDTVLLALNLFALMLNSGDNQIYGTLEETKKILNQAFVDYNIILESLKSRNEYTFDYSFHVDDSAKVKYKELIDKSRDNIQC